MRKLRALPLVLVVLLAGCFEMRHDQAPRLFLKEVRVSEGEKMYRAYADYMVRPVDDPLDMQTEHLKLWLADSPDWDDVYRKGVIIHENHHAWNMRRDFIVRLFRFIPPVADGVNWRNEREAYKAQYDYLYSKGVRWSPGSADRLANILSSPDYGGMVSYSDALVFCKEIMRIDENIGKAVNPRHERIINALPID